MADDMAAERAPQPRGSKRFRGKPSSMPKFLENPLKDTDELFEEERQRPLKPLPETPDIEKVTGIREGIQVPSPEGQEVELESFTPEALKQAGEGVLTHTPERPTDRRGFLKILAGAAVTLAGAAGVSAVLRNSSDGKTPEATPTTSSGVVKPETPPPNISPTQVEPTVAATPTETPFTSETELLPFEIGLLHEYADGRIQTILDKKLMQKQVNIKYMTKSGNPQEKKLSGLSDFVLNPNNLPNVEQNVVNFFEEITYKKWIIENPHVNITLEEFTGLRNKNKKNINGIEIPPRKIYGIAKTVGVESLQVELHTTLYYGMRENKDRLVLISGKLNTGVEGFDAELGPSISETDLSVMGALYVYGDLQKGGQIDLSKDKGTHYWEDIVPLVNELRGKYFKDFNSLQVKPASD